MHVVVVGALPQSLVNFQGDLIRTITDAGHRVTAMSDAASEQEVEAIEELGARHRAFSVDRTGLDPRSDLRCLQSLRRAFRELDPDVVMAYTVKPVVWGGLALRSLRSRARFYGLVTGLGYAFDGEGFKRRALTHLVARLYRASLKRADRVIFLNPDNRDVFVGLGIVGAERCDLVAGSGVDTRRFAVAPLPGGEIVRFLVIARLLRAKGLCEYVAAAAIVKARYPATQFDLVGPPDTSPDAIPVAEVEAWSRTGMVRWHGATSDVRPAIAACHVYVLPSYHEGLPRSVQEAMSMGRPILTTDVPGCRETVSPGENGWLVPKADAEALAERMIWFIENQNRFPSMARASREVAVEKFDVHVVNRDMMRIMGIDSRVEAEPARPAEASSS